MAAVAQGQRSPRAAQPRGREKTTRAAHRRRAAAWTGKGSGGLAWPPRDMTRQNRTAEAPTVSRSHSSQVPRAQPSAHRRRAAQRNRGRA